MERPAIDTTPAALTLDAVLASSDAYDLIDAAVAIIERNGRLLYQNDAFAHLNHALRDASDRVFASEHLLDSPELHAELAGTLDAAQPGLVKGTFYYEPNACVDLTLRLQPLSRGGRAVAVMVTVAEESIEHDQRHLARLQHRVRCLAERMRTVTREKMESERLVRSLLRESPFPAMLLNGDRQIIRLNRAAEDLVGIASREAAGKSCSDILRCPYQDTGCGASVCQAVNVEETTITTGTGESIPVLRSSVVLDDTDEAPMILETFVDIRERKRAEHQLRRLSESNQLILDSTGEGIIGTDTELRCTFANRAAAHMLGYTPDELLGQDVHALLHHSEEDETPIARDQSRILRTIRNDASHRADDTVLWHKNGTPVPVQYHCNPIREGGRTTGAVLVYRDVTETRAMAREMSFMATHDPLTGLVNRREFERRLAAALESASNDGQPSVLCYLDLDQFKVINDTCGHAAGDALLRRLTEVLQAHVPTRDSLARIGGDEFAVLFNDCDLEKAHEVAEGLRAAIEEFRFAWEGRAFTMATSMGLVALGADTPDVGAALSIADSACHIAKDRGRNRIQTYRSDDDELVRRHGEMQWIARVNEALENDHFCLYGQPIVAVDGSDIADHLEILVRMQDRNGDLIPPGKFIPAAERYNLMRAIDTWVVEHTFRWLAAYGKRHTTPMLCSINLSGQSISDARFHDRVLDEMHRHSIPPEQICFEITETAAIDNLAEAERLINRLREHGCHIALDDFGSGMSSFAYLKNLPIDAVKIDGHFVRDMDNDPVDRAMVEAIHQVAHVLGLKTIAEFVEDDAIRERLRTIGVDFAQGFGIQRPAPLETFD